MKIRSASLAIALLGIAVSAPVAAKSVALITAPCTKETPVNAVFLRSGSSFILGFTGGTGNFPGPWHTTISDTFTPDKGISREVTWGDDDDTVSRPAPNITWAITLPKGEHKLHYKSVNGISGEVCITELITKN